MKQANTVSYNLAIVVCISFFINSVVSVEELKSDDVGRPLFLTPLIEQGKTQHVKERARVYLPDLNIESYSGYLTVNKKYNSNLFFWYFPAQKNPSKAPVVLWLQGGPGLTSFIGLFNEHGPFFLNKNRKLQPRTYSWNRLANMIYIDSPAGTGYSFTQNPKGYARNQDDVGRDLFAALSQFFEIFTELRGNDFYVSGDTYGGKFVPGAAYYIHNNNYKLKNKINLKGISIGNGLCDPEHMVRMSYFLYEIGVLDTNGKLAFRAVEEKIVKHIQKKNFGAASTHFVALIYSEGNTLFNNLTGYKVPYNFLHTDLYGGYKDQYATYEYLQTNNIRRRIHVGNLTFHAGISEDVTKGLFYDLTNSTRPLIEVLVEHYRIIIYSGHLDMIIPYTATENFLKHLKWSGAKEYKKAPRKFWYVDEELAGYSKTVKKLTEVVVRNASHLAPVDQPKWVYCLFKNLVKNQKF